jgi:hypothetical protein
MSNPLEVKVGIFSWRGSSGKMLYNAYTVWYNPQWKGCCEHIVERGPDAKKRAIEQHKQECEGK